MGGLMRKTGAALIAMLACLMVSPILLAQEEAKPVILLYHGPKVGDQDLRLYGEALADLIESDSRLSGKAEIVLVGDQDLMNTLLYFPQVKCVVIALTNWELSASRIVPSTSWYFNEGGGVVGLGNAGHQDVTGTLNGSVFPIFGNMYQMVDPTFYCQNKETGAKRPAGMPPRCDADELRITERVTKYVKVTDHDVAEGAEAEFITPSSRFVIHKNQTASPPYYLHLEPDTGEYTMIYADGDLGAPLLVVYEQNGTSITFAGTDQISVKEDDPTYFGTFTEEDNFITLFQNAVYYVWSKETKYDDAMAKAKAEFAKMEQDKADLEERVKESQSKEKTSKLLRSVLLIVVGVVLIVVIAYWAFVIPARQGGEEEAETPPETPPEAPTETPTEKEGS